jgi:hypothetical protein
VQKRDLDLLLWERQAKQMQLRQYTPQEVETFLREDELDAKLAQIPGTGSIVAATAGVLKSDMPPLLAEKERRLAEQVIAEDVMERSGN